MRLDRLSIPNYRNLRLFEIDFYELQPTTVLIGRNGSGKSNLIEAIVEIFRELELGGAPGFAYQLQYVCREHTIRIDADPARPSRRLDITVDGKSLTQTAFQRDLETYLPNYVFAYYSGWSSRLERHFDQILTPLRGWPLSPRGGAVGWSDISTAQPADTTTAS